MEATQPAFASPADSSAGFDRSIGETVKPRKPRLVHIRELDGIRGMAALMVFFHHLCFTSIRLSDWGPGIRTLYHLSSYGSSGVDLFFVLSGFLITSLLIQDRDSSVYYRNFYWKRVLRILPLYILCLVGVYLFVPDSHAYVLLAALFVVNFAQVFHVASTGPFWTLAIEEQFYLLWPTVVRRRSVPQLVRWSVGIGLSAVILRLAAASIGHHNYDLTFLHCDGLAIGAFVACRYSQRSGQSPPVAAIPTKWIAAAFVAGVVLFACIFLPYSSQREFAFMAAAYQTGISLLAGSVIAFVIVHTGARYLAIFRSRLFTFFGLISYAVYMIHTYVLMAYDHLRGPLSPGNLTAYTIRFVTVLGISVLLSLLTYYLIERPALSLRKYVLAPSHPSASFKKTEAANG
ncbi:acyltransferase [Edaphobacter sp. DSM 109919]|uniref:Acyltransferase n=1 Tax=Edaphobacter paludis TaxID=3035702 RepID=A0AAU7CXF8_9BACT